MKKQQGFNLLEVLVAAFLLSLGLLGMAGMQASSMKVTHNSYQMQQASQLAAELLERMRANKSAVVAGAYQVDASAATYCGNALANSCQTAACTHLQMATDDLFRVMCGYGSGGGVRGLLLDGRLVVTCPGGDCQQGVQLGLQWNERNADRTGDNVEPFNLILNAVL